MQKREFTLPVERCPICGATGTFQFMGRISEIPYFGEMLSTSVNCTACKFRHADVMCFGERKPARYEFTISSDKDMMVRVVKSSTGTVRIPQLGVKIDPGPASEGYVSNVEGVLERIETALTLAMREIEQKKRARGERLLKKLQAIRDGKLKARLIILDPSGNSAIVDERAKKRGLTRRELATLKTWAPAPSKRR